MVLWSHSLIAGIYDSVDATGPVAEVDYVGNEREKGSFVSLFISPLYKVFRKPRGNAQTLGLRMTSHKMVLYVFKKDELLFLTYPKKSILPLLNISMSFVPCQVTHQGKPTSCSICQTFTFND